MSIFGTNNGVEIPQRAIWANMCQPEDHFGRRRMYIEPDVGTAVQGLSHPDDISQPDGSTRQTDKVTDSLQGSRGYTVRNP
jgi:hypothetical protein